MLSHLVHRVLKLAPTLFALLIVGVLVQWGTAFANGVLFVSPVGNDANSCLTMAVACRTIGSAVSKALSGDTIIIASGIYTEGVTIDKNLTLIGFGVDATIIDQGYIYVAGVAVQIFDLALTNGHFSDVGGLVNYGGDVLLGHTSILSGYGNDGGGIYNFVGTLTVDHTTVAGNEAARYGGGIYSYGGNVSVSYSSIVSNTTCNVHCIRASTNVRTNKPDTGYLSNGGGIYSSSVLTVTESMVSGNTTQDGGGGLASSGTARLTNVTVSGNQSTGRTGGGITGGVMTLTNVTLTNNSAPSGGGSVSTGIFPIWFINTIIANALAGNNCDGTFISLGHNLSSDNSCNLTAAGDLTNTNPLLGPLQDNGGPTPTHALLAGSPAINHGDNAGCPATDQRGIPRPQAGICDIGAYEYVFPFMLIMPVIRR